MIVSRFFFIFFFFIYTQNALPDTMAKGLVSSWDQTGDLTLVRPVCKVITKAAKLADDKWL